MEEQKVGIEQATAASCRYDSQAITALVGGILLILISFFTNYSYDDLPGFLSLQANKQIGVSLHIAALAALAGEIELASRVRARSRNQEAQRAQLQARCTIAQFRFLLADTARNRLQLSAVLALLLEDLKPAS